MKKFQSIIHQILYYPRIFKSIMIHLNLVQNSDFCKHNFKLTPNNRKLMKFRGKDAGKSKFEIDKEVNQIEFPGSITMKSIFTPMTDGPEDKRTPFGEIVFQRSALDFT